MWLILSWLLLATLAYPFYLFHCIAPYTFLDKSVNAKHQWIRGMLIFFPAFLLMLLTFPIRWREDWSFEQTHLVVGVVAFCLFKKTFEYFCGRVEPSVLQHFTLFWTHWVNLSDVAFRTISAESHTQQQHAITSNQLRAFHLPSSCLTQAEKAKWWSRDHALRQGLQHLLYYVLWMATASCFALVLQHYVSPSPFLKLLHVDMALAGCVVASCASSIFHLIPALTYLLRSLLSSEGIYISPTMRNVFLSTSIADFWRAHWNIPIHDTALYCVYIPLGGKHSIVVSSIGVMFYVCLFHEYESLLWNGKLGKDMTIFFVSQVVAVAIEKWYTLRFGRMSHVLSRLLTIAFLLATFPYFFAALRLSPEEAAAKALSLALVFP